MKVLFDVTSLLSKNLTTDGIYTKNLYRMLRGLGVDISPVFKQPKGVKENYIEAHIKSPAGKFYGLFSSKGAIVHGPSGNLITESDKFKKVISINDLSMFRDGMMGAETAKQMQTHLKEQMQCEPAAIIVPSYDLHNEFLIRFPKFVNRVHVIEPGCDHILDSSSLDSKRIVENPYFVFVGTIDKKSNIAGVLKAFNGFCSMKKNVQLVIVGDNGYGSEAIHKLINGSSIRERINIVGYKSGAQLKKIYADAIGTIIPSFNEGFSFPLVESMKMGCPVLTSALGSMKDIGGEAAHLVNPKDPEQIMAGMERIFADRVYRDKMTRLGQGITEKMTWLKCARELNKVYQSL